jgi:DNA-binding transcriptional LysR family regulator
VRIRNEAPGVELHIRSPDAGMAEDLETGRLDLAVGVFGRTSETFAREPLFEERLVWAVRADHPAAAAGPLSLDSLRRLPLLLLSPTSSERAAGERPGRGIERLALWNDLGSGRTPLGPDALERIKVVVDTAHAALAIVGRSDLAALVPRRLAMTWSDMHGLKLTEISDEAGPATPVEAVWRADQSSHPALSWLRGLLRETAREA